MTTLCTVDGCPYDAILGTGRCLPHAEPVPKRLAWSTGETLSLTVTPSAARWEPNPALTVDGFTGGPESIGPFPSHIAALAKAQGGTASAGQTVERSATPSADSPWHEWHHTIGIWQPVIR